LGSIAEKKEKEKTVWEEEGKEPEGVREGQRRVRKMKRGEGRKMRREEGGGINSRHYYRN
jgi:hypothetical protein